MYSKKLAYNIVNHGFIVYLSLIHDPVCLILPSSTEVFARYVTDLPPHILKQSGRGHKLRTGVHWYDLPSFPVTP